MQRKNKWTPISFSIKIMTKSKCQVSLAVKYSFNGCQLTERTRNCIANDQREITPKISKSELWFLCMTHRFIVLYNCMKFHFYSFNGCQLTEPTRNCIANDPREVTPKIYKAELWFLCMTHRLIVLYNCMKFHLNSFNGCQLTEPTRNCIANDQREMKKGNKQCLFDTPRILMVNKENNVRIQRPQNMQKAGINQLL